VIQFIFSIIRVMSYSNNWRIIQFQKNLQFNLLLNIQMSSSLNLIILNGVLIKRAQNVSRESNSVEVWPLWQYFHLIIFVKHDSSVSLWKLLQLKVGMSWPITPILSNTFFSYKGKNLLTHSVILVSTKVNFKHNIL